ncbi:MAG: heme lyase CcmF/NrfE family subunit [Anaerolineaceae bacterium]|nr:heme lyase CcmF/NrfE family subunit [Anaerolineaceae bacterium]
MLAEFGFVSLLLALLAAAYALVTAIVGARRQSERMILSARNAALLTCPLLIAASLSLMIALITGEYQLSYVWSVSDPNTPLFFRITALWGSQKGSILFWSTLMSIFAAAALLINWRSQRRLMPYVIAYTMATLGFFLVLNIFYENPFERWWLYDGSDVYWQDSGLTDTQRADIDRTLNGLGIDSSEQLDTQIYGVSCLKDNRATEVQSALRLVGVTSFVQTSPSGCVDQAVFAPPTGVSPTATRLAETAQGLNPLLRHFGMIIHPPMLYLGFVGFVIPFAFAMAALASGDLSTNWIKATRRWALVAWLFLSLGLILGGRWAYDVLGWGGYWGWDPVENAAFLPWLVGTAFLHSVMIQEKRGMLKVWNMFLVIGTFSAVIFGTFATRSGLIDSVHSFARSEIGFPMFFFWAGITLVSVGLILWRWNRGELKDEHRFMNLFSRESLFVLNNVIFLLLFVVIFWGSFGAPVVSELALDTNITLGTDYFYQVTPWLFLALYVLMGIAPLSAWGATSLSRLGRSLMIPAVLTVGFMGLIFLSGMTQPGALIGYGVVALAGFVAINEIYRGVRARMRGLGESPMQAGIALFARNRRRYGGYIIHIGVTIIGIGVIGSTVFQQETQRTLSVGESLDIDGYQMTYLGFDGGQIADDGRIMDIATVAISRDNQTLATIRPRRDFYPDSEGMNSSTIAGAYSTVENDFYVILVDWEPITASNATFKVYINPLVNLVWWGGLVLILGTLIAAWPNETAPVALRERQFSGKTRRAGAKA